MSTLAILRDQVETLLMDESNQVWPTGVIDKAFQKAISEYDSAVPRRAIATLALASDTRELSISSIAGLLDVERVWLPYTAASPEDPPEWKAFEHWRSSQILFFPRGSEPQSGDVARIFYTAQHTLNGLDSASATTIYPEHYQLIVDGAAGHSATSRSVDLMEQVTLDRLTSQQVRSWGLAKLQEFRAALSVAARREGLRGAGASGFSLDRWDQLGDGWS